MIFVCQCYIRKLSRIILLANNIIDPQDDEVNGFIQDYVLVIEFQISQLKLKVQDACSFFSRLFCFYRARFVFLVELKLMMTSKVRFFVTNNQPEIYHNSELFAPLLIHRFEPVPVEELDTPVDFQHISRVCIRRGRFSCFFDLDLNLKLNTPHLYCNKIQYA